MCSKRGSIVEMGCAAIKTFVGLFLIHAHAEEPATPTGGEGSTSTGNEPDNNSEGNSAPVINYEDLISKAREEEKRKQYAEIGRLKAQVSTLTEQHNGDLLKIASLEKERDDAKKALATAGKGDSEEVVTLKGTITALTQEKEKLEAKVAEFEKTPPANREEIEAQVRQELTAEFEVKAYRTQILAEYKDDCLVPELVMGDTKEALDQSMQAALARSEEIRKNLGISTSPTGDDNKPQTRQKRTPRTPANPNMGTIQSKQFDMAAVAQMDVTSPEYAKLRKELGL